MALQAPINYPTGRFYYHYKHDPNGPIENYAYEVIGVGCHTEDVPRDQAHFVVYRPLYQASVFRVQTEIGIPCFDVRPLDMWMGTVEKDGVQVKRFTEVTNPSIIESLMHIRNQMYGTVNRS